MSDEYSPRYWDEIPWPIKGYEPHFEMSHEIYEELLEEYPNVDVEQEADQSLRLHESAFSQLHGSGVYQVYPELDEP